MTSKLGPILVGILAFMCVATGGIAHGQARDVCPPRADNELVEAVFRYQLERSSKETVSGRSLQAEKKWHVFYLAFGLNASGEDCLESLLAVFRDYDPPVRKFILPEFDVERLQKEKGLVLGISGIKRTSETEAEVEGYSFVVPGQAQGRRYYLVRENGKWIVKSSKGTWIA